MADHLGKFELEHVPPHLVSLRVKGDVTSDDVDVVFDRIDVLVRQQPFWLLEIDLTELGQANLDARRTGAERIGKTPAYSAAFIGGSLAQRALATLFLKVSELFSGDREIAHKFIKEKAAARAWLLEEGRRRASASRREGE